ncbi:MAG: CBS domain-containing protein, partial [Candidatus Nitrosocosmicus sp.]|nr:CBS domain-containing protein [Candidatus Nitrosocosmicus sp.]
SNNEMISQEISRNLYESLKDVHNKNIKEFVEDPILTKEDVTISKIIGMMLEQNVHEVFIQLPGKSISCINIRDILSSTHIETLKSSTMGKPILSLTEKDNIGNAARLMNLQRLRSIPVVDQDNNQEVIGQISSKRIIQHIYETFSKKKTNFQKMITASDIMTPGLITLDPSDKFDTAKGIMKKDSIDHLPVVEKQQDGNVVIKGMITSDHIIQTLIPAESIGRRSLGSDHGLKSDQEIIGLADKNVVTIKPHDTITSTIDSLLKANSTYTIVKSSDDMLGIITYRDIISLLGEQTQSELPVYIIGMPDDPFDSELIKSKFYNIVEFLNKISPKIEEARCRIKAKDIEGNRKRYEVTANIFTTNKRYIYTSKENWDLVSIFDDIREGLRNQVGHEKDERQKGSMRYPHE